MKKKLGGFKNSRILLKQSKKSKKVKDLSEHLDALQEQLNRIIKTNKRLWNEKKEDQYFKNVNKGIYISKQIREIKKKINHEL